MSRPSTKPLSERAKGVAAGAGWLIVLGVVIWFFLWPLSTALRGVWLPVIRTVASGSPSMAALVTLSLYAVPSVVLTVLVTLRIRRKPGRRATIRRTVLAAVLLLPGLTLQPLGRGQSTGRVYAEVAEHMGAKGLADAVAYGYGWGMRGLLLWVVLGIVSGYLMSWRRLAAPTARGKVYPIVSGTAMAAYWAAVMPIVAHRAATVPLDELWAIRPWLG